MNERVKSVNDSARLDVWCSGLFIPLAKPADGSDYINHGVHIIKVRWGKVFYIHAYFDTQLTIDLCRRLAAKGIPEATLPPIED